MDKARISQAVREILSAAGEDPDREGLRETPERVAGAYARLLSGLDKDPLEYLDVAFDEEARDLVVVRDLPVASICEHHLLPMQGRAHVAYLPQGKVVGFSEISLMLDAYARRPQLQERLTAQVADALYTGLGSRGSLVTLELSQACMTMRHPQTTGSTTVTRAARGVFESDAALRRETLSLFSRGAP